MAVPPAGRGHGFAVPLHYFAFSAARRPLQRFGRDKTRQFGCSLPGDQNAGVRQHLRLADLVALLGRIVTNRSISPR